MTANMNLPWWVVGLALVILLAAFFRFYQIGIVPAEMTSDHAEKLLDVREVMNGKYSIFFPRNTGREPLEFYMAVPLAMAVGLGHLALKMLTASVSLMSVPVVFFIGREIAGARFGLLAAFFLAVSMWDVAIGRVGLRFPYYPLFAALAFYFLMRALRGGNRNDFMLCGLVTGIGLYGYSPFRVMPLLIGLAVLVRIGMSRTWIWSAIRPIMVNLSLCLAVSAIVFVPLAHYMVENPQMFWQRTLTRLGDPAGASSGGLMGVLLDNLVNASLMFNWRGDTVWVNTVPGQPALDWISGALFLLGVGWCLYGIVRDREPVAAYLLLALVVLLLPSVLSLGFPAENPSVVRAGGATPIVSLMVAVPIYLAARRMAALWQTGGGKALTGILTAVLMVLVARVNFDRYFIDYASQYRQSSWNSSEIAATIDGFSRSVGSLENAYLVSWPHWVDTRNVAINLGDPNWNQVLMTPDDISRQSPNPGNKLYILNKDDKEGAKRLQQKFPEGQLREQPSPTEGRQYLVFFVPGSP